MLHFDRLIILHEHIKFLQQTFEHHHIFVVGGAVRDCLLGLNHNPTDIDFTLAGEPESYRARCEKNCRKPAVSFFKTEKFGTMTVVVHATDNTPQIQYECTPFRTEGDYDDFRHPGSIHRSSDLLLDSARRDFTINSLYYVAFGEPSDINTTISDKKNLTVMRDKIVKQGYMVEQGVLVVHDHILIAERFSQGVVQRDLIIHWMNHHDIDPSTITGILIDPYGGVRDLVDPTIKAVGDPDKRFGEDALRIIRALRFVINLNCQLTRGGGSDFFDFENTTRYSIKKNYYLVQHVAKERIKDELVKVFKQNNPFGFIALCDEINILGLLFPALANNKYVEQPVRYHPFDVYTHTMLVLYHAQQLNDDYLFKFGALYHDVGKKDQYYAYGVARTAEDKQAIHAGSLNHVNSGPEFVETDFTALGFSTKEKEIIKMFVHEHMRPGEILSSKKSNRPKKVRKLLSDYGYELTDQLFLLCKADRLGQFNPLQPAYLDQIEQLRTILKDIFEQEGQFTLKQLAYNGHDIMRLLGIEPGPEIKTILDKIFVRVRDAIKQRNNPDAIKQFILENKNTRLSPKD